MYPADPVCGNRLGRDRLAFEVVDPAAADAFAAVVFEAHRPFSGADQLFVELIEGLQQGEVGEDSLKLMALVTTGLIGAALAPDAHSEFHL